MIQMQTRLKVADNSGARKVQCIKVLGGSKRMIAGVADIIKVSVKEALPDSKVKKGEIYNALIVRVASNVERADGTFMRFKEPAVIMLDKDLKPIGTRVFGPVMREIRNLGKFNDVLSLAPEVI